jgi:predicted nucleic acid-binding protein
MSPHKGLVLDANILVRAVFGVRVRQILETYEDATAFYSPDACFSEAKGYIPDLAKRRRVDSQLAQSMLEHISRIVEPVDKSLYESHEKLARERIEHRDPRDWPVISVAMLLDIPIWTEDQDFFWKWHLYLDHGSRRDIPSKPSIEPKLPPDRKTPSFSAAFLLIPAQAVVPQYLKTFEEFPPRQRPASFNIGDALEKARQQEKAMAKAVGGGAK